MEFLGEQELAATFGLISATFHHTPADLRPQVRGDNQGTVDHPALEGASTMHADDKGIDPVAEPAGKVDPMNSKPPSAWEATRARGKGRYVWERVLMFAPGMVFGTVIIEFIRYPERSLFPMLLISLVTSTLFGAFMGWILWGTAENEFQKRKSETIE